MLYPLRIHVGHTQPEFSAATVATKLTRDFGGATVLAATGAWVGLDQQTVIEPALEILVAVPAERRNEVIDAVERLYPREQAFGVEWRGEYFILHRKERLA